MASPTSFSSSVSLSASAAAGVPDLSPAERAARAVSSLASRLTYSGELLRVSSALMVACELGLRVAQGGDGACLIFQALEPGVRLRELWRYLAAGCRRALAQGLLQRSQALFDVRSDLPAPDAVAGDDSELCGGNQRQHRADDAGGDMRWQG